MEKDIYIFDTTLREGEQSPGVAFSPEEKVNVVKQLDAIGVPYIEVGLIGLSDDEEVALNNIKELSLRSTQVSVASFLKREHIHKAYEMGYTTINLIVPTSTDFISTVLKKSSAEVLKEAQALIKEARDINVEVNVALADASRSTTKTVILFAQKLLKTGANIIIYCDTVGIMTPSKITKAISNLKKRLGAKAKIGVHLHNDFGLATANAISAAEAGAQYLQGTINGIGERAGISNISEVILGCELLLGLKTGILTNRLPKLSFEIEKITGLVERPYAPITGLTTFWYESGVPASTLYKAPELFQPIPPHILGKQIEIFFGKHSGKGVVINALEHEGITITKSILETMIKQLKILGTEKSKKMAKLTQNIIKNYHKQLKWRCTTKGELIKLLESTKSEILFG